MTMMIIKTYRSKSLKPGVHPLINLMSYWMLEQRRFYQKVILTGLKMIYDAHFLSPILSIMFLKTQLLKVRMS